MATRMLDRHQRFKAALEASEHITEDDVRAAMDRLPCAIWTRLERGPLPYRYDCGVCEAFGKDWYSTAGPDLEDPMWVVWVYHELPKLQMAHRDQLHYGELANETYRRAIATYRAAGWRGEAKEANA